MALAGPGKFPRSRGGGGGDPPERGQERRALRLSFPPSAGHMLAPPGALGQSVRGGATRIVAWAPFVVVGLAIAGAVVALTRPFSDRLPDDDARDAAAGGASAGMPVLPPRCQAVADAAPLRIGDPASREPPPAPRPDSETRDPREDEDELEPFAPEVGRAARYGDGFAVGVKREVEGASVAEIAIIPAAVGGGRFVRLGALRGDVDAPIVVPGAGPVPGAPQGADARAASNVLAGLLESDAGGFTLKIARLEPDATLKWGAELPQGHDESLAYDLAASPSAVVAVWDDDRDERSAVMLAALDPGSLALVHKPRVVSSPEVDAELPRVVARPGGFWLAYLARPTAEARVDAGTEDNNEPPEQSDCTWCRPGIASRFAAQNIEHGWLEVVPLGQDGLPSAAPRPVSPRGGHALTFDIATLANGDALVAWRDDDTPVGSDGGRVALVTVALGGAGTPTLVLEGGVGSGVPNLIARPTGAPGSPANSYGLFLSVPDERGGSRIGLVAPDGTIAGDFRTEPALGHGAVVAADGGKLLLARPSGKALELALVRCTAEPAPPPEPLSPAGERAP